MEFMHPTQESIKKYSDLVANSRYGLPVAIKTKQYLSEIVSRGFDFRIPTTPVFIHAEYFPKDESKICPTCGHKEGERVLEKVDKICEMKWMEIKELERILRQGEYRVLYLGSLDDKDNIFASIIH